MPTFVPNRHPKPRPGLSPRPTSNQTPATRARPGLPAQLAQSAISPATVPPQSKVPELRTGPVLPPLRTPVSASPILTPRPTLAAASRKPERELAPEPVIPLVPVPRYGSDRLSEGATCLYVPANSCEVFTELLEVGSVYRLDCWGVYGYGGPAWLGMSYTADAVYAPDGVGNFSVPYWGMCVDGKPISAMDSFAEDRYLHGYCGLVEGAGRRLALRLSAPNGYSSNAGVRVAIELMPRGTKTARVRQVEQVEMQKRAIEQEEQRVKFEQKVEALRSYVRENGNFLDENFCQDYLARFPEKLLCEHREQWSREYRAVFCDPNLVAALKVCAPEVL